MTRAEIGSYLGLKLETVSRALSRFAQDGWIDVNQKRIQITVPDGLRADPGLFPIFEWAESGELPHLKKLMDKGIYGYSRAVFPSHTPVNFATLMTGSTPDVHGVVDGPIRKQSLPLAWALSSGFSSTARKKPALWQIAEEAGYRVGVVSVPGSTPPDINSGTVVRGRWPAHHFNAIDHAHGN